MKKASFTWSEFHSFVNSLSQQIDTTPNIIISIGKGGLIPGTILAEHYECNNLNLGLKSYKNQTRETIHEYQSLNEHYQVLRDANLLIVDDIADSGETFKYAVSKFKAHGCERIKTASVFYKPCSKFKPDYFSQTIDPDIWIVQPWEKNK
jgi:hypoxanthine phosphoribosyltransferase